MASTEFKQGITSRFNRLVVMLNKTGKAKNNSEVAALMNQPVQIMSKLLNGDRIVTLEQVSTLAQNAGVNSDWLLTGRGTAFRNETNEASEKENLVNRVTTAIFQAEIPKELGEDIIRELMAFRDNSTRQQEQINELNLRIIKMLDLAKNYSQ